MDSALRTRIVSVLEAGVIDDAIEGVVAPRSTDGVVALCRICAETHTPMTLSSGIPAPVSQGIGLSVNALHDVRVNRDRQVVYAGAGSTIYHVREAVARAGLSLIASTATDGAQHVGSLVARGALPRRALTGILAVLPSGERVAAQGGVHKDVTGYDLAGLLLGSMGRLAVITAVYFRLIPAGVVVPVAEPAGPASADGIDPLLLAAFDPGALLRPGAVATRLKAGLDIR